MRCGAKNEKNKVAPGRYVSKGILQTGMPLTLGQCRQSQASQIGIVKSTASSLPGCWAGDASPSRHTRQWGRITTPLQPQRNVRTSDSSAYQVECSTSGDRPVLPNTRNVPLASKMCGQPARLVVVPELSAEVVSGQVSLHRHSQAARQGSAVGNTEIVIKMQQRFGQLVTLLHAKYLTIDPLHIAAVYCKQIRNNPCPTSGAHTNTACSAAPPS